MTSVKHLLPPRTLPAGAVLALLLFAPFLPWHGTARAEAEASSGVPVRLVLPAIGVDAPVQSLALGADLTMPAPQEARLVAWYTFSAEAGAPGNAVLAGHRDWQRQRGAFFDLGALRAGDTVWLQDAGDTWYLYTVVWSDSLPEETTPVGEVVGPTSRPLLTLITCSGTFSQSAGQYLECRVVRAELTATIAPERIEADD